MSPDYVTYMPFTLYSGKYITLDKDFHLFTGIYNNSDKVRPAGALVKSNIFAGHSTWTMQFKVTPCAMGMHYQQLNTPYYILSITSNNSYSQNRPNSNPVLYMYWVYVSSSYAFVFYFTPYKNNSSDILTINNYLTILDKNNSIVGTTNIDMGRNYWIRVTYDGEAYKMYLSTDGENFTQEGNTLTTVYNLATQDSIPTKQLCLLGAPGPNVSDFSNQNFAGYIHMKDCYLESEGVKYWFNQYAENVYEDYTDYHLITKGNTQF